MSEEIICSECGRPNLPEAEKCWYCQSPLKVIDQGEPEEQEVKVPDDAGAELDIAGEPVLGKVEDDIPEWLKRIRELKKADQPEEDDEDHWHQQILFDSQSNEKSTLKNSSGSKPRSAPRISGNKTEESPEEERQPLFTPEAQDSEPKLTQAATKDTEIEETVEDETELPDGFTPLDTKKG